MYANNVLSLTEVPYTSTWRTSNMRAKFVRVTRSKWPEYASPPSRISTDCPLTRHIFDITQHIEHMLRNKTGERARIE